MFRESCIVGFFNCHVYIFFAPQATGDAAAPGQTPRGGPATRAFSRVQPLLGQQQAHAAAAEG